MSKTSDSNIITIAPKTKAAKNIKPPLRKSELVEALATRERANIIEKNNEIAEQLKKAKAEFYTAANAERIRKEGKIDHHYMGGLFDVQTSHGEALSLRLTLELSIPPDLLKQYRKIAELEKKHLDDWKIPSLHDLKRKIREQMDGHTAGNERVAALLRDPATQKALDATLEALKKPAQPALMAAAV